MLGLLIICMVMGFILWNWKFSTLYIERKYEKGAGSIDLPYYVSRDEIKRIVDEEIQYPAKGEINFDQNGNVHMTGMYGEYSFVVNGMTLKVEAGINPLKTKLTRMDEENIYDEAICIRKYLQQYFYKDSGINLAKEYNRMLRNARTKVISTVIGVIFEIVLVIVFLANSNFDMGFGFNSFKSKGISDSYLTQYSTTRTVGETMSLFFGDTEEWDNYKVNNKTYVECVGDCIFADEKATMTITFEIDDDSFWLDNIEVDGIDVGFTGIVMEVIYEEADEAESYLNNKSTSVGNAAKVDMESESKVNSNNKNIQYECEEILDNLFMDALFYLPEAGTDFNFYVLNDEGYSNSYFWATGYPYEYAICDATGDGKGDVVLSFYEGGLVVYEDDEGMYYAYTVSDQELAKMNLDWHNTGYY